MGNNRQNNALCARCMRTVKWVPVLLIVSIVIWSYYAYVIQLCILSIDNLLEKIILLIFYHLITILFIWSYWNTIFTPIGTVPPKWRIPASEQERFSRAETVEQQKRILEYVARDLPVHNRTVNGLVRFCDKCNVIKPDRTHHCSVCDSCVLKMDHHCPWVNNCVNFTNYKFFVLFLGYALIYCIYVALTSLEYFIKFWEGNLHGGMGKFHILFLFFLAVMFAISLISLFGYHIYLVIMNRTTLEAFRAPIFRTGGPDKNGYNIGKLANFQEVFGDNWKLWFIPVYTSRGDGIEYPMQSKHQRPTYESMGNTPKTKRLDDASTDKFLNKISNYNNSNNSICNINDNTYVISFNKINNVTNYQLNNANSNTLDEQEQEHQEQQQEQHQNQSQSLLLHQHQQQYPQRQNQNQEKHQQQQQQNHHIHHHLNHNSNIVNNENNIDVVQITQNLNNSSACSNKEYNVASNDSTIVNI